MRPVTSPPAAALALELVSALVLAPVVLVELLVAPIVLLGEVLLAVSVDCDREISVELLGEELLGEVVLAVSEDTLGLELGLEEE
jgi:hypothetical protein